MPPDRVKASAFEFLRAAIAAECGDAPILFIIENAHWIDPTTDEWIQQSLSRRSGARTAVLRVLRAELADATSVTEQVLAPGPLDLAIAAQIAASEGALDDAVAERVAVLSGGVPSVAVELARGAKSAGDPDAFLSQGTPPTLLEAAQWRADQLPPESRATLEAAAILGYEFDRELLEAMQGERSGSVLEERGYLSSAREGRWQFQGQWTRDAIQELIVPAQRQKIHARAATTIEARAKAAPEKFSAELAWHWTAAGDSGRAAYWSLLAARRQADFGAGKEAIALCQRVIELLSADSSREARIRTLRARTLLGKTHEHLGHFDEAEVAFGIAAEEARSTNLLPALAEVLLHVSRVANHRRRPEESARLLAEAQEAAIKCGASNVLASTLVAQGESFRLKGKNDEADDHFARAEEIARRDGITHVLADVVNNRALVAWSRGNLPAARELFRLAIQLRDDHRDLIGGLAARANLGMIEGNIGNTAAAVRAFEESSALSEKLGNLEVGAAVGINWSDLLRREGRCEEAIAPALLAVASARQAGSHLYEAYAHINTARALNRLGRGTEARAEARAARNAVRRQADQRAALAPQAHRIEAAVVEGALDARFTARLLRATFALVASVRANAAFASLLPGVFRAEALVTRVAEGFDLAPPGTALAAAQRAEQAAISAGDKERAQLIRTEFDLPPLPDT